MVIDNLKAAVTKADRYEPTFQRTFEEYTAHRGFIIDAAIVRHPTGKPHVERNVQYVPENFFRGEQWIDIDHVQRVESIIKQGLAKTPTKPKGGGQLVLLPARFLRRDGSFTHTNKEK